MKQMFLMLAAAIALATTGCCSNGEFGCHPWGCGLLGSHCNKCGCDRCQTVGMCNECNGGCGVNDAFGCKHGHDCFHKSCGCNHCGGHGCNHCRGAGTTIDANEPSGPPTGTVAYPYYTTRGPRDFFANNPPSIGPY